MTGDHRFDGPGPIYARRYFDDLGVARRPGDFGNALDESLANWRSLIVHVTENVEAPVKALFEARLSDLGPRDFLKVECAACGHAELLATDQLRIRGIALPPDTPVLDLERRLRCRECDARGKAVVSVKCLEA
jgi:hypothetical protein